MVSEEWDERNKDQLLLTKLVYSRPVNTSTKLVLKNRKVGEGWFAKIDYAQKVESENEPIHLLTLFIDV